MAEKIGLLTILCCFKLHDICIDKTNFLIYIVPFSIFFCYPKFINYIPNFTLLRKFIIHIIVRKFFQMNALFYSRVAKTIFKLNYNFFEATKLFIIIGNITYVFHAGNLFLAIDIPYKKMFLFDYKIIPSFLLILPSLVRVFYIKQKVTYHDIVLEGSMMYFFTNICFYMSFSSKNLDLMVCLNNLFKVSTAKFSSTI